MVDIILACGGNGSRAGLGYNKLKFDIGGMSALEKTLSAFSRDDVNAIYVSCSPDDKEWISAIAQNSHLQIIVCDGGASRTQSVWNALSAINRNESSNQKNIAFQSQKQCNNIAENCQNSGEKRKNIAEKLQQNAHFVLIHDGARPFVSQQLIDRVISTCEQFGSAIPCLPCSDSLRQLGAQNDTQASNSTNNNQKVTQSSHTSNSLDCCQNNTQASHSVNRNQFVRVQTPQAFEFSALFSAYSRAIADKKDFADDASLFENYCGEVHLCDGEEENTKLTYPSDFRTFTPDNFFVGNGWDTHQLVDGRKLILGGLEVPHSRGLLGHSDADVLLHAIMDAILSASNNRDIGCLFPDSDERYKNANSAKLLQEVMTLITSQGFVVNNLSAVVMAQQPKLKNYIPQMQAIIAQILNVSPLRVSLSATTTEKLGLVGHEQAISANAYCSLRKKTI